MHDDPTDFELVRRSLQDDDRAFGMLVERYEAMVASVTIRMLGAGPDAEDVGQETFIRFYRTLDRFRGDAALGTYLTRIAMNLSLNALKRRKVRATRHADLDPSSTSPEPTASETADAGVAREQSAAQVTRALDQLSPKHKAVVVLRLIEGRSTKETSAVLGVPAGTVMSRLKRAIEALRPALEGDAI